jgi:hypothetical protein
MGVVPPSIGLAMMNKKVKGGGIWSDLKADLMKGL